MDAIRLGSQVQLEHQSKQISQAIAAAEVIGPVASVTASGLTVLGQTVLVNADGAAPTVLDGIATLSDLPSGAFVEVHGQRNSAGEVRATRIELRTAAGVLRVAGTVAGLANGTFKIGSMTIRSAQAALLPAGQTLAEGQRVTAWTDQALVGGELIARVIRVSGMVVPNGAALTIDGVVTAYRSVADLRVGGFAVDAGAAQIVGGVASDLRDGRQVRASGSVTSNVLRATRVEFLAASAVQVELTGAMAGFVDTNSTFRVRNTTTRVTPQTSYVRGDATNLGDGVLVKVEGPLVNGVVEATKLDFLPTSADFVRVLFGNVSSPVTTATDGTKTFRLAPLLFEVRTTSTTRYKKGTVADIAAGRSVKVQGIFDGLQFIAEDVQFMGNVQDPPTFSIDGIASNVQPTSVIVDGKTIVLTSTTVYRRNDAAATLADLKNGSDVEVDATRLNGTLYALTVDIKELVNGSSSVRGIVSRRTSPTDTEFLVGSQRVSVAGDPRLVPGNKTLADIKNGIDLEVDGTVTAGLLTAKRIRFR